MPFTGTLWFQPERAGDFFVAPEIPAAKSFSRS
jgi:hypothetical protein